MAAKSTDSAIKVEKHEATINSEALNRSTNRVTKEAAFLDAAVGLLRGLNFPAYRQQIIDHIKAKSPNSEDSIVLFESLDHYIRYDDVEQVRAAFEVNLPFGEHHATPWRRDEGRATPTTPAT